MVGDRDLAPAPAAGAGAGLLATINPREERFCVDLAVGQGLLQFDDTRIGDPAAFESELLLPWLSLHSSVRYGGVLDSTGARPTRA